MTMPSQIIVPPQADDGTRCLTCDYNLTGLTSSRCPECGTEIDWVAVRRARDQDQPLPGTTWDRWPWYLKPVGFVVTALTAALLPWLFARQLPARPRLKSAMAFAGACFALAAIGLVSSGEKWVALVYWLIPAAMCLLLVALLLGLLVPPYRVKHPMRFWLAVCGYLCYALPIESLSDGPPFILYDESDVWPFSIWSGWTHAQLAATVLFYLWWADLAIIAWIRCRPERRWRVMLGLMLILPITILASYLGYLMAYLLERWH